MTTDKTNASPGSETEDTSNPTELTAGAAMPGGTECQPDAAAVPIADARPFAPAAPVTAGGGAVADASARRNPFLTRFLTLPELYQQPDQDDWLVKDVFCRGELVMVYGDSGSGKTFVAVDLLVCLATGEPWCSGQFSIPFLRQAVYATGEGRRGIAKRFCARDNRYREQGGMIENPGILVLPVSPQLFDRAAPHSVDAFVAAYQQLQFPAPDLVVLDTLNRAAIGGDENATKDVTEIIAGAELIRDQLGAAVLLVHHTNKMGGYRGNTALRGSMDCMIEIRKLASNSHLMHCEKLRDGEEFPDQSFHLFGYESSAIVEWEGPAAPKQMATETEQVYEVLRRADGQLTARQIAELTGIRQVHILRSLDKLKSTGRVDSVLTYPDRAQSPSNPRRFFINEEPVKYYGEKD